jgi:hypothetical protein
MAEIANTGPSKNGQQAIQTDFYGIGGDASLIQSAWIKWDATLVATITIWVTNIPDRLVPLIDPAANLNWTQLNPSSGYTAISGGGATAVQPLTLIIAGGTAGNAHMDFGNCAAARMRAQVVCTTGGFLEIWPHGKD